MLQIFVNEKTWINHLTTIDLNKLKIRSKLTLTDNPLPYKALVLFSIGLGRNISKDFFWIKSEEYDYIVASNGCVILYTYQKLKFSK